MSKVKSTMLPRVKSFLHRALLSAALLVAGADVCRAQTNVAEFGIPSTVVIGPYGIACGADGAYWFAEYFLNQGAGLIGRIDTVSNAITQYGLLTNHNAYNVLYAEPFGICRGPAGDSNLWFTESYAGQIGRISTNGTLTEFPLANLSATNGVITAGPDNNLWFIEYGLNRLAAINPAPLANLTNATGTVPLVHEYGPFGTNTTAYGGLPGTNAYMEGLTSGSDGNLWFTQYTYGTIGKLNPATGAYILYQLPSTNSGPYSIVQGADGAFWFSELNSNSIGRITTSGQVTEYLLPLLPAGINPYPCGMLAAGDGNIWFTEYNGSAIGRITPSGIITLFPTPTSASSPFSLATGPDGNIWFTEYVDAFQGQNLATKAIGRLLASQSLGLSLATTNLAGTNFTGLLATFQNSTSNNTVTVAWGDGNYSILNVTSLSVTNPSASVTNVVISGAQTNTNTLTITQTIPIDTNNNNGTFTVSVNHTYAVLTNYNVTVTVVDPRFDTAVGNIGVNSTNAPPMFLGEHITNGKLVLSLAGVPGRTYTIQSTAGLNPPHWTNFGTITIPTNSSAANFTNPISPANHFFRLSYP